MNNFDSGYWSIPNECRPPHHQLTHVGTLPHDVACEPGGTDPHTTLRGTTLPRVRPLPSGVDIIAIMVFSPVVALGLFLFALWFQLIP